MPKPQEQKHWVWDDLTIEIALAKYRKAGLSCGQSLMNLLLDITMGRQDTWDNYRPSWLKGLELDRFYKNLDLAFEFQGEQHYTDPSQQQRDRVKAALCAKNGITLRQVNASDLAADKFVARLSVWLQDTDAVGRVYSHESLKDLVDDETYRLLKDLVKTYRINLQRTYGNRSAEWPSHKMLTHKKW